MLLSDLLGPFDHVKVFGLLGNFEFDVDGSNLGAIGDLSILLIIIIRR